MTDEAPAKRTGLVVTDESGQRFRVVDFSSRITLEAEATGERTDVDEEKLRRFGLRWGGSRTRRRHRLIPPHSPGSRTLALRVVGQEELADMPDIGPADSAVLLYWDGVLLVWTDDYGNADHPDHDLSFDLREAVEALVEAAGDLLEILSA